MMRLFGVWAWAVTTEVGFLDYLVAFPIMLTTTRVAMWADNKLIEENFSKDHIYFILSCVSLSGIGIGYLIGCLIGF